MIVEYAERNRISQVLGETPSGSLDFVVFISGACSDMPLPARKELLDDCIRVLRHGGILFVQGVPRDLPELGVYLDRLLTFKYWIAVESTMQRPTQGLPSVHAGVLLFSKGNGRFSIHTPRFPHEYCAYCGRPLRDWGGKAHLMNPRGYAASDVWKAFPPTDNYTGLSSPVLDCLLSMVRPPAVPSSASEGALAGTGVETEARGIVLPEEGIHRIERSVGEPPVQYRLPGLEALFGPIATALEPVESGHNVSPLWNTVIHGDAVETLRHYPDESVDLAFADPPYNLDKSYGAYDDERRRDDYLVWCNTWLDEYIRILKPTGSLYILNLPRWTMYHAAYLNQRLHFQNWIVWDALSEPRGKLMPAHYGLLFYTKRPTGFTFNYGAAAEHDARYYCLRPACVRQRKTAGVDDKEPLTDIWADIHRLKHRRDRDYHPCQLPDALMERIILLSSNPGDIVLDALAGTGTTAVVAARLGRRYVAIDIDAAYVEITRRKIAQVQELGQVIRPSLPRPRPKYAKKSLQLELRELAMRLGRLPTPEDVQMYSRYGVEAFRETFPTWGKALKAAKLLETAGGEGQ